MASGVEGAGEKTCACVHANTDEPPPMCTHPSILYDQTCVWCCTWQSVRQYRGARRAAAFMSPLLLRYIVTANMKSGLFCQKCVNKHGNASSEGHNSILRDKCGESAVAFGLSHKITEQTKVVVVYNDLILTFFFFLPSPLSQLQSCYTWKRNLHSSNVWYLWINEQRKMRGKCSVAFPQKTNTPGANI